MGHFATRGEGKGFEEREREEERKIPRGKQVGKRMKRGERRGGEMEKGSETFLPT